MNRKQPNQLPHAQARRQARLRALQGLYQHEINPQTSHSLIEQFQLSQDMSKADLDYFAELLKQIITGMESLNEIMVPYLDIPLQQMDVMERCIIRIGLYELSRRPEIPFRVILSEAVALAKKFGAEDGHKFVNAVLDKAAADLRPHEQGRAALE
jgi:N utilization substance protein B